MYYYAPKIYKDYIFQYAPNAIHRSKLFYWHIDTTIWQPTEGVTLQLLISTRNAHLITLTEFLSFKIYPTHSIKVILEQIAAY